MRTADSVRIALEGGHEVAIRWLRNRLHFHPCVLRLAFEGFDDVPPDDAYALLRRLFPFALTCPAEHEPLLLRVTLDSGAALLPHLRDLGFLDARGVHVVNFAISDLLNEEEGVSAGKAPEARLVSLAEAVRLAGEAALIEVWAAAYGRAARLDPATPHVLPAAELRDLLLGDEDLDVHLSVCVLASERLVGVCPIYRSPGDPLQVELGTVGVGAGESEQHQAVSSLLLRAAAERAAEMGVERLVAEVDADAPESVYLFAGLPGRVSESLVSLMYVPRWNRGWECR